MCKSIFRSIVLSLMLLLSGCTSGEVKAYFWLIGLVIIGSIVWEIIKSIDNRQQKKAARSTALARIRNSPMARIRNSQIADNILIDVEGRGGVVVDTANKQVGILRGRGENVQPTMISYRDVLSSEIIEDGETVTKTSRGSQIGGALIGGLALGGVGAIIGGLTGATKSIGKVSKIALMVTINNVNDPVHYVLLLNGDSVAFPKSHPSYKNAMGEAQRWHGKIQVLMRQADEEDRRQEKEDAMNTVAVVPQTSLADELTKLGELRDKGILTEAEFGSQKAKLLNG